MSFFFIGQANTWILTYNILRGTNKNEVRAVLQKFFWLLEIDFCMLQIDS